MKKLFPNVSRPSNPPDELAQNVSKKKKKNRRTNCSSIFSSKVQNLTVFAIIHMIRIRFFGPEELKSEWVRARTVKSIPPNTENWLRKLHDKNYNNDTSNEDKHETSYSMNNDTRNYTSPEHALRARNPCHTLFILSHMHFMAQV